MWTALLGKHTQSDLDQDGDEKQRESPAEKLRLPQQTHNAKRINEENQGGWQERKRIDHYRCVKKVFESSRTAVCHLNFIYDIARKVECDCKTRFLDVG
jgi:hypothetical protein